MILKHANECMPAQHLADRSAASHIIRVYTNPRGANCVQRTRQCAHLVTCVMKMLPPIMVTYLDMR